MSDPFLIDSPTCISFSGGRTSAYMLWRVLQSNQGLPAEATVIFCNTGKEDEATLRFVQRCSVEWDVPITWLEFRADSQGYAAVTFDTASRNGEPFEQLINKKQYLPNTFARFCTSELNINIIKKHMKSLGFDDFVTFVGIRADEPRRVAKMRNNADEKETPLATIGVGNADVLGFWKRQPFDLETVTVDGNSLLSNCDLCFMKKPSHLLSLIKDRPQRAVWWAEMESKINARFNQAIPSYNSMTKFAEQQTDMFDRNEEGLTCFCGD